MEKNSKYAEIAYDLKDKIKNNIYLPGDLIPTELELCEQYNVSRITVRKALQKLVNAGLLIRKSGTGTFVNTSNIVNASGMAQSFTQDMIFNNKKPGSKLLEFKLMPARSQPEVAKILKLEDSEIFFKIKRLRTGDDLPIALSYTYVPYSLFPELTEDDLDESLYAYVEKHKMGAISDEFNNKTVAAVMPTKSQKSALKISDEPLLKISHDSKFVDDTIFEYTETYYIGSRFVYTWAVQSSRSEQD